MSRFTAREYIKRGASRSRVVVPTVVALSLAAAFLATGPVGGQSPPIAPGEMTVVLAGDAIIVTPPEARESDPKFMAVVNQIRKGDASIVQLEGTFASREAFPVNKSGGTWMHFHPDRVKGLQWMGFNLFPTANNHTFDFGVRGVQETIDAFRNANAVFAGIGNNLGEARAPNYLMTPKGRVGLISRSASFHVASGAGAARPDMHGRPGLAPLRHERRFRVDAASFAALQKMRKDLHLEGGENNDKVLSFNGNTYELSDKPGVVTIPHPEDLKDWQDTIRDTKLMARYVFAYIHAHDGRPGTNNEVVAEYVETYARAAIDAGADMFAASGPHFLRGIEVYKGKLIFYSLGNFIMENDLVTPQPSDNYTLFGLGPEHRPADLFNARSDFDRRTWPADHRMWKSVLATVTFRNGNPAEVGLMPVTLGFKDKRPDRGYPAVATGPAATDILEFIQKHSKAYGTNVVIKNDVGTITIGQTGTTTAQ